MNFPERYNQLQALLGELAKESGTVGAFNAVHQAAVKPGALDTKTKELISLGISIAINCEGCMAYHVHDSLAAGAKRPEIIETIGVAVMMGGGPGMMHGCEALEALDQFTGAQVPA